MYSITVQKCYRFNVFNEGINSAYKASISQGNNIECACLIFVTRSSSIRANKNRGIAVDFSGVQHRISNSCQ